MAAAFPNLSTAELETLLAALDPHLGDHGSLADSLGDPPAFLSRVGLAAGPVSLIAWLEGWRTAGGSQEALLMTLQALLDQRRSDAAARSIELVWSGPDAGAGSITRDQSVLIRQLVERAEHRLLQRALHQRVIPADPRAHGGAAEVAGAHGLQYPP